MQVGIFHVIFCEVNRFWIIYMPRFTFLFWGLLPIKSSISKEQEGEGKKSIQISITVLCYFKAKSGNDKRWEESPFLTFVVMYLPASYSILSTVLIFKSYLTWVDLWLLVNTLNRAFSAFRKINSDFVEGSGYFQMQVWEVGWNVSNILKGNYLECWSWDLKLIINICWLPTSS